MATIEIILLALTLIKELAPYVKKMVDEGNLDADKAPDFLLNVAGAILPITQGLVIKNNPAWEGVIVLIRPILESLIAEKAE